MDNRLQKIQDQITEYHDNIGSVKDLGDTHHTFGDLYHHRRILSAVLFRNIPFTWRSKQHDDGTMFDNSFIVGAFTPDGCISYHYDLKYWEDFKVPELMRAPRFDNHTPNDVIERIDKFYNRPIAKFSNEEIEKLNDLIYDMLPRCLEGSHISMEDYISFFIKKRK